MENRSAQAVLRAVIEATGDVIFVKDLAGRHLLVNSAAARLLGCSVEDMIGATATDLFPPEVARQMREADRQVLDSGQPLTVEEHLPVGDATRVYLTRKAPYRDDAGRIAGLLGIGRDITARVQGEEAHRQRTHERGERVKELNCLYGISALVDWPGISLEEILQGTVDLIPAAWQYPEVTGARVVMEGQEFRTPSFREDVPWRQAAGILLRGQRCGVVEVCYLEQRPESDEGPFLKEERSLLNAVAERLGRIVERLRAEQALTETNQLLAATLDHTHMLVALLDPEFNFVRVNRAYARADEREPEFFPGRNHFELYPHPENEAIFQRVVDTGEPYFAQARAFEYAEHPERGVSHWDWSLVPTRDPAGSVTGLVLTLTDVTERVRAEMALQESEGRLQVLTASTPAYIYELDAGGTIQFVNRTYEGLTGEQVVGTKLADWFPEAQRPGINSLVERAFASGVPQVTEYTIPDPQGEMRAYVAEIRPILARGRPQVAVLTATDITERARAEEALREAHNHLERRVGERTAELARANELLQQEIAIRLEVEEALQQRLEELSVLDALGHKVGGSLSLDQVVAASLEGIVGSLSPDLAMLFLRQGDGLVLQGLYPKNPEFQQALPDVKRVGQCLCGLAVSEGQPCYSPNIHTDPRCTLEECKKVGMRSFTALPLFKGADVLGVLGLASIVERDFAEQSAFLEALAAEIAIGLQNALLHQEVQGHAAGLEQEVVERGRAEEALHRANRALQTLSECNRVLSRAERESELLGHICRIAVDIGGYRLAWVGFAQHDEARTVQPVAQAGFEEGYLATLDITWADTERGRGPTGTAIRTGEPFASRNILTDPRFAPWRAEATRRGYASSLALPLTAGGQTFGALNIYAAEPDAFHAREIALLTELADNLAYGIVALRTRAQRQQAEQELAAQARELARSNAFLSALNQVSTHIQTTHEPDQVLETLGTQFQALGLYCAVALLEPNTGALVVHYTSFQPDALARAEELAGVTLHGYRVPRGTLRAAEVIEHRRAQYVPDLLSVTTALFPAVPPALIKRALRLLDLSPDSPAIYLPLAVEERVLGLLAVWGENLRKADVPALSVFAAQVAVAFERARLTREAAQAEVLREVDRLRSELVANVSHEIRTPLGLIEIFCTSLLMEDVELDGEVQRQFLTGIQEETGRLNAIVDNLLNLGRMEGGRFRLERHPTDLGQLAAGVMATLETQLAGHRFVYDFAAPLVATVDPKQVEQVLRNLLGNAIRYSPEGGSITVRGYGEQGQAVVCVSDEGIGIPAHEQERIFERFYRVDNETTRQVSGVGLGLAVCRGIVEAHGGRIWVESAPGAGSSFHFTLPLATEPG